MFISAPAEAPYEPFRDVPDSIEENMPYNFSCSANVGNPPGKITWWRFRHGMLQPDFMGESSVPGAHPGQCVYNVTSSKEYNMTDADHLSVWRCSVDNDLLTTSPDYDKPYQESQQFSVLCKIFNSCLNIIETKNLAHMFCMKFQYSRILFGQIVLGFQ
jgi:hypothetical protein